MDTSLEVLEDLARRVARANADIVVKSMIVAFTLGAVFGSVVSLVVVKVLVP